MDDLISIIIPVYKVEKWLNKCIDSVLAQTYEKLEIILVDDGSPDKCPVICDAYALKDTRVIVIHKSNGGLSSARNSGLDIAGGKYIVFVDSDDYIHPHMIESVHGIIEETQADLAMYGLCRISEDGREILKCQADIGLSGVFSKCEIFEKMYREYWVYCVVSCNKMYRRSLWEGYRYPEGKIHEDEFAVHNILKKCEKIVCTTESYYYYRQRNGSIMTEKSAAHCLDAIEAYFDRQIYFIKEEMMNCVFLNERRCFNSLCEAYSYRPEGREMERYKKCKAEYYQMHKYVIKKYPYPVLKRIQVMLYLVFPWFIIWGGNCRRKIKNCSRKEKIKWL